MSNDTSSVLEKLGYIFRVIDAVYLFRNEKNNDFCKRSMMRSFFIQVDNVTKIAPRVKNTLYKDGVIDITLKKSLEELLKKLLASYEKSYDIIRDKLGAHNQPIDILSLHNWWNGIDYSSIEVLYGDIKEIQSTFESIEEINFLNIPDYSPIDIPLDSELYQGEVVPSFAIDRLAFSKPNTTYMVSCHDTQDKAQLILSIIEFLEVDFAVTVATNNPTTIYTRMVFDIGWMLAIVDLCSLIDNLFVDTQHDKSLLQYWKGDMGGYNILLKVESARDHVLEDSVRKLRNTLAAHIDDFDTISDIYKLYEQLDLMAVHAYAVMLVNAFRNACRLDIRTKIFLVQNVPLSGVVSIQKSVKPFEN